MTTPNKFSSGGQSFLVSKPLGGDKGAKAEEIRQILMRHFPGGTYHARLNALYEIVVCLGWLDA